MDPGRLVSPHVMAPGSKIRQVKLTHLFFSLTYKCKMGKLKKTIKQSSCFHIDNVDLTRNVPTLVKNKQQMHS